MERTIQLKRSMSHDRVVTGIYCIRNVLTNQLYIGSSYNVGNRINQHCKALLEGTHHNRLMQSDFDFYDGQTCLFKYRLLKQLSNNSPAFYIHAIENKYIVEYKKKHNLYNIATPSKRVGMNKLTMNLILFKNKITNLFDK